MGMLRRIRRSAVIGAVRRRHRGGSEAFNPDGLEGQVITWDVSDSSSLTIDGSNLVQQMNDKSGNGNHMIPGPTVRPQYFANGGSNNKAYVRRGSGKTLGIDPIVGLTTSPFSAYIVCKMPNVTNGNRLFFSGASTSGVYVADASVSDPLSLRVYNSATSPFFSRSHHAGARITWMLVKVVMKDADSMWLQFNDEPSDWFQDTGGVTTISITRMVFESFVNLDVSEVRAFNRVLSSDEDADMKAHLIEKYNLQPPSKLAIFFGDSHTLGILSGTTTLGAYTNRIARANVVKIVNHGRTGSVVDRGTHAQAAGNNLEDLYSGFNLSKWNYCKVVFQYGTNDTAISTGVGAPTRAELKAAYKSYIQSFIAAGFSLANLIICTPPFSTGAYVRPGGDVNAFPNRVTDMRDIATELGITLCDFYQAMITAGQDCNTVVGGDGIHADDAIHTTLYDTLTPLL